MYKPYDFDPTEEYRIVAYVYLGPQIESVSKSFSKHLLGDQQWNADILELQSVQPKTSPAVAAPRWGEWT